MDKKILTCLYLLILFLLKFTFCVNKEISSLRNKKTRINLEKQIQKKINNTNTYNNPNFQNKTKNNVWYFLELS
jgi:hypothetical protein